MRETVLNYYLLEKYQGRLGKAIGSVWQHGLHCFLFSLMLQVCLVRENDLKKSNNKIFDLERLNSHGVSESYVNCHLIILRFFN